MSQPLPLSYDPPRQHPRIAVNLPAKMSGRAGQARAVVGDLSSGGLYCRTDAVPAAGSRITLRFRLLTSIQCEATGRVVWTGDGGFGVAFEESSRQMASFTSSLTRMTPELRTLYLAGVLSPTIVVG